MFITAVPITKLFTWEGRDIGGFCRFDKIDSEPKPGTNIDSEPKPGIAES